MLFKTLALIGVGVLWGCTNPFIKKYSKELKKIKCTNPIKQFFLELYCFVTNIKYIIPFLINQSGSVLYFITLQNVDISLSVPVANSLTFVFTALTGWILGEQPPKTRTIIGTLCVLLGTFCCCYAKMQFEKPTG